MVLSSFCFPYLISLSVHFCIVLKDGAKKREKKNIITYQSTVNLFNFASNSFAVLNSSKKVQVLWTDSRTGWSKQNHRLCTEFRQCKTTSYNKIIKRSLVLGQWIKSEWWSLNVNNCMMGRKCRKQFLTAHTKENISPLFVILGCQAVGTNGS